MKFKKRFYGRTSTELKIFGFIKVEDFKYVKNYENCNKIWNKLIDIIMLRIITCITICLIQRFIAYVTYVLYVIPCNQAS